MLRRQILSNFSRFEQLFSNLATSVSLSIFKIIEILFRNCPNLYIYPPNIHLRVFRPDFLYSLVYDHFFQRSNVGGRNKNKNKMSQNKDIKLNNDKLSLQGCIL